MTLQDLIKYNTARNAIWDPEGKLDWDFFVCELGGEIGELCNLLKKQERVLRGIRGSTATLDQIKDETADCAICLGLVMMSGKYEAFETIEVSLPRSTCPAWLGKQLLIYLGYIAEGTGVGDAFADLFDTLQRVAKYYSFDLMAEVRRKFNATSTKYNLPVQIGE